MKRFTRAVSLCLLLALVLTAFGIFTSFAESAIAVDSGAQMYGKVVYDMDAITSDNIAVSNKTYGPNVVRNDEGYWEMNYEGYDPAVAGTAGDYWNANVSGVYINNKYTTEEDGTKTVTQPKNTDFFVIDFDIGTDTSLLDGIYFHNRWYTNTGGNAQQNYVQLNGTDLDNFYISTYNGGSCIRPATTPGEWLNVTIVYDFSSVDEEGYAVTGDWKIHVYLDGIWCGNLPNISSKAVNFYFNRISTDARAIQNGPDAATQFANFTYVTFPRGYEGTLTEAGVLGYTGCTLADIPELAYCLADTPAADDRLIATVEREGVDEPIEVYNYDELDASLLDGDVVTLERSITTALVLDSNANVTFKDKNGTVLTPGTYTAGDLVYIEKPYTLDFTTGSVIRRFYDNPRKDKVTDSSVTFPTEILESYAPAGASGSYRFYSYILLEDATFAASATTNIYGDILETDLNGYTLTLAHTKRFESNADTKGDYPTLKFCNGTLVNNGAAMSMTNSKTRVIFEDLNFTVETSSNMFDQRGGIVIYNNVKGTSNQVLSNAKGAGNTRTTVLIKDSDLDVIGKSVILATNVASGGKYQGGMKVSLRVMGSNLSASTKGHVVELTARANSYGTYATDAETGEQTFVSSSAVYDKNDNDLNVYIDDSVVSAPTSSLINTNIVSFLANSGSYHLDVHEQFSLNVDCRIRGSEITAVCVAEQEASGYASAPQYADNYEYNVDLSLEDTDLYMDPTESTFVVRYSKMPTTSFNLEIGAEVSAPTNDETKFISAKNGATLDNYNLTYIAKCIWMKRTLEGAPAYTYTNKLDTHSYIFDGHEYEFQAYLGDPINESNIPQQLPPESDLLKYEWQYNIDGAWEAVVTYKGEVKANVTIASDLSLNVYIPATFGDDAYDEVYVEGYKVTVGDVTVGGVDYKVITIPGVDPASATKDFTVRFRAVDENASEATVEREISVLDYIEAALADEAMSTEGKQLVAALLNYIEKVAKYNAPAAELDPALAALLASEAYTAIDLGTAAAADPVLTVKDLGIFQSARIALDSMVTYEFLVNEGVDGVVSVSYTVAGTTVTEELAVVGGEILRVDVPAHALGAAITITRGETSGSINLAGYRSLLSEPSAELTAVIDAIAIYAQKAAAYNG